jgi:peptidoglycan hydrolase CwlO-like protein
MSALENMKKQAEILRLQSANADDQCRIEERRLEIERIETNISNRSERIEQLKQELEKKD